MLKWVPDIIVVLLISLWVVSYNYGASFRRAAIVLNDYQAHGYVTTTEVRIVLGLALQQRGGDWR